MRIIYQSDRIILTGILTIVLILTSLFIVKPVSADTILVTTNIDEVETNAECSLREAILAANSDSASYGCSAGSGADTITLPEGVYTLTHGGGNNLPFIESEITING